jgi:hypothetical protein
MGNRNGSFDHVFDQCLYPRSVVVSNETRKNKFVELEDDEN